MFNWQTVSEREFGNGIDAISAENQIKPSFVEMMTNVEAGTPGLLNKRKGYQGEGGNLPFRVAFYSEDPNKVCFTLDTSISLSSLRSVPIVVYGRLGSGAGQFNAATDTVRYYLTTEADVRVSYLTGSNTLNIPFTTHAQASPFLFVGTAASTAEINYSNSLFLPSQIRINKTSYDVSVDYVNSTPNFLGMAYVANKDNVAGINYQGDASGNQNTNQVIPTGISTVTLMQTSHQLNNNNIGVKVFRDDVTHWEEVIPDKVMLNLSGDISITLTNNTGAPFNARIVATAVDQDNITNGSVAEGETLSISFNVEQSPFLFTYIYLEDINTNTRELVLPDSIVVDDVTKVATVTFTNNTNADANFYIYYEFADVQINEICASLPGTGVFIEDANPQLTLWGLDHTTTYNSTAEDRPGWVQHIDSYKSAGERYLVAGLGGNFFAQRPRAEVGTAYLLPQLYPRMTNRLAQNERIAPAFTGFAVPHLRTRGTIQFTGGDEYLARASSITFNSGTGWVDYVLEVPGAIVRGADGVSPGVLTDVITANEDYLTVSAAGYKRHQGEFLIKAVSLSGNQLTVSVLNTKITSADWNETDSGAQCGVYTDRLTFLNTSEFIPNDVLLSELFGETEVSVVNVTNTHTIIKGITSPINLPAGLRVAGQRTGRILPLRTATGTPSIENFVIGDMIELSGITRKLRVHNIVAQPNTAITIDGNSITGLATITLGSGSTATLGAGEEIVLFKAGPYSGQHTIESITSLTTFTIAADIDDNVSGTLLGYTLTVDEDVTFADSVFNTSTVTVGSRWIPIEAPTTSFNLPAKTHQRHLDSAAYSGQPTIRSTMVQDSMFFTNGEDEVTKYDGVDVYRAGLPRWQPQLFMAVDKATERIVVREDNVTASATTAGTSTIPIQTSGGSVYFVAGDRIYFNNSRYTVERVDSDNNKLILTQTLEASAGSGEPIYFITRYRYYFRLNMVDKNRNVIASATTGANDNTVELLKSSSVKLKLIGLPAWDIYDYNLLEVEIYRTKANTIGPFYRVATLPMSFNNNSGYIEYTDTTSDEELVDLDSVVTVLKGRELAPALSLPLRAKYVTSAGNSLVLANLTDYKKLSIVLEGASSATETADLTGKKWLFRKDNTDTATVTNMVDRATYEWTLTSLAFTSIAGGSGSFTVTYNSHGLVAGNWVYLFRQESATPYVWPAGTPPTTAGMGWWQVASADANTFTITDTSATASMFTGVNAVNRFATATVKTDVPVYLGVDQNYDMENGNLLASDRQRAMRRLANAINTSMRMTNVSLTGQTTFTPWMIANAGSEFGAGQIVIEQPKVFSTFLEVVVPTGPLPFTTFVNNKKVDAGSQQQAVARLYPSRLIASYQNYPEIFDNVSAEVDAESDSVVDVNSADGQEITGVIPFFGDSAFGSAQKDSIIVVFKTNSIYLVNLAAKRAGQNPVQKLDSQGLGCTYPYSIANTRQGIIFANEAGVYRVTRNMTVDYVGRMIERYWDETVSKTELELVQGHNYALGRQYKLSYPLVSGTANTNILVYDHTQEYGTQDNLGGWTIFDNHPATGWANLDDSAYFGSSQGRVFSLRKAGDKTDYRDDDQAINASVTFRALDFGDAGVRKYLGKIILHLRTPADVTGTRFFVALDLQNNFAEMDEFEVNVEDTTNGVGDSGFAKVTAIKFNTDRSKFIYLQNKITNDTKDEGLEVTKLEYRLAALTDKAITDAARTKR